MKNFNFLENTTAIIVLYGENEKILGRNLDNLKNIKKIIIDNGGDKKLKKKIISKYNVEKYILNEKNIGYSAACNQGLRLSDSRFSLVINPDCIITEKNLKIVRPAGGLDPRLYNKIIGKKSKKNYKFADPIK